MFKWYTNGEDNLKIKDGDVIPENFKPGFSLKEKTITKKARDKRTKELNSLQLKTIPLKERKQIKKQIEFDKIIEKEKKQFLKDVHIPLINQKIHYCLGRGLNYIDTFEQVKLKDGKYSDKFNTLLEDYIIEQALIYQLSIMPTYMNTIFDSLKNLYEKNKILQHRKDLISYFTSFF
jgi:hypothetical protein